MPPKGGFLHLEESEMNIEQYLNELIDRDWIAIFIYF